MSKISSFANKTMLATMLLIAVLTVNMAGSTRMLHGYVEKESIQILWDNVHSLTKDIVRMVKSDKEQLGILANIIAKQEKMDSPEVEAILYSFTGEGMISDIYLLLPDNTLLSQKGGRISDNGGLDFREESVKESYISSRQEKFADIEEKVIYHAIPIEREGGVEGILYGIVRLQQLSELYEVTCFDGQAEMYLMEGKNGNFLMDTWHQALGSTGEMGGRKTKPGYDFATTQYELKNGITGMSIFTSKTSGEYLYYCYEPAGINDWMVAMTVPEPVVFSNSETIHRNLWIFAGVEMAAVIIYFIWILHYKKKEDIEKEAQLNQVSYMYDIQKTLFDAHQRPERVREALGKVGEKLRAETAFFIVAEGKKIVNTYSWTAPGIAASDYQVTFPDIEEELGKEGGYLLYSIEKLKDTMPEAYGKLERMGIHNIMLTQVKGSAGKLKGVLGTWNMNHEWKDTGYLECVMMQFFLAYKNIKNQALMDEMASVDALTGLLNRNSHELALKRYAKSRRTQAACIYIDVNGLHEINNYLGHAAGDEMLCCVAGAMQQFFGREDTYRIGGDEFLIFVFGTPEEEIQKKIEKMVEKVESRGYHISVGMEYRMDSEKPDTMIAAAEKKMYEVKKEYYRKNKNVGKEREMNRKLEEILLEKKDADTFLSFLAPRFAGVYITDLEKENVREIYIPEYFKKLLEENNRNFYQAFLSYVRQYVEAEEQKELLENLKLERIKEYLEENTSASFRYRKTDGSQIELHIYKTAGYGEKEKEIVWIFEKV